MPPDLKQRATALSVLKSVGMHALDEMTKAGNQVLQDDDFARTQTSISLQARDLQSLSSPTLTEFPSRCIRFPHFSKDASDWIPLVWIMAHRTGQITLQLVLAGLNRRFGFRWEPPESGTGRGTHEYYHVQPIKQVRKSDGKILSLDFKHQDVCDHFPTFPIDAQDLLHLVDALLVSLYGPKYHEDMIKDPALRKLVHSSSKERGWWLARTS